jgi:(2Fe-2S) ferredoxin
MRLSDCIESLLSQKPAISGSRISPHHASFLSRLNPTKMPLFEHHIFICTNERDATASRPSCLPQGSKKLKSAFKDAIKDAGLKHHVRANESGCLDQCEHGPVVVIYPEAVWYGNVHPRDVAQIVQEHLVEGRPVERLRLPESCVNSEHCPHRLAEASK